MGDTEHTLKLTIKDIQRASAKRPVLVILQGHRLGLTVQLDKPQMVIGRGSHCDVVLSDEVASRQQLLQDGDKIKIGKHLMKFAMLDEFEAEFQERLHEMTQRDELTGLRSRRSLFADLDRAVQQAATSSSPQTISVLMADIDFFKRVNDGRGHLVGSQTIREVGHIIRDVVGSADLAARYGGEEYFAYIYASRENGFSIAERIRQTVEQHPFPASTTDPDQKMYITISLGVASFPEDGTTALELLQKADQALYRAKLTGRNRICMFDKQLDRPDSFHPAVEASAIMYGPADAQ